MCKRRQVAGSTYTSLFRYYRDNIILDMPDNSLQGLRLHAGIPTRQRMHFGNEHDLRNFNRYRVSNTYAMALQDLMLQGPGILFRNMRIGQDAKTCIDPVNCFIIFYDTLYMLPAGSNLPHGLLIKYCL